MQKTRESTAESPDENRNNLDTLGKAERTLVYRIQRHRHPLRQSVDAQ